MKIRSLFVLSLALSTAAPVALAANPACSRVKPGHYIRVSDDNTRSQDGLKQLNRVLSEDLRNFKGIAYMMPWGMLEKSRGVYDFSRLDTALARAKAKGKYLMLYFQDRTFHSGCGSSFVPSYVAREVKANNNKVCYAKIWQTATMNDEIRVLQKVAQRYKGDPYFLGILVEETAMRPKSFESNWNLRYALYDQLKRAAAAVQSVAPNLLYVQQLNWPASNAAFYDIADALQRIGGGGSISWPNTIVSKQYSYSWYQVARDRRDRLVVMPRVEHEAFPETLEEHDRIYNMLVNDIRAHKVIWDTNAPQNGYNYLTEIVIPTVNKYKGAVRNTTCPY